MINPDSSKYIRPAISALLGSFLMYWLLGIVLVLMTLSLGDFFAYILVGETKLYLLQSIIPTIFAYAWLGYKTPIENIKFNVFKFAWKYSVLINLVYWLTYVLLVLINADIGSTVLIISICGFSLGTLIWPYTIGPLVIFTVRRVHKIIYK